MASENPAPDSLDTAEPKKKAFYRKPLGCALTLLVGGLLFSVLLIVFAVWFAGSNFAVGIAADVVNKKSGGNLSIGENHSNLFAGRVHYKDIRLTNPSRFTDKEFVTINELKTTVALGSLTGDVKHIKELVLDIGSVAIIGSEKWTSDNNAFDFKNAFAGDPSKEGEAKPAEPKKAGDPLRYKIDKLVIKLGRVRLNSHATTPGQSPRVIFDKTLNLNWTFDDVTEANLNSKVLSVIGDELQKQGYVAFGAIGNLLGYAVTDAATGLLGTAKDLTTGVIGTATDVTTGVIGGAAGAVTGTVKAVGNGVSGAVSGLIGGLTGKTDEKKDEKKEETK